MDNQDIIVEGVAYRKVMPISDKIVLVRTYSAGVHFGEQVVRNGKEIVLANARRLWSWQGACSLSQVAVDGVDVANSKISVSVPEITLTEAIEIITMTAKAAKILMEAPAWKQ